MEQRKKRFRFPIALKAILMIVVFALVIVEVSVAYYSIMMSKTNQTTYMSIANSVSATTAEVVDVDDVKYLKDQISPIVKNSPIRPVVTEDYDEAQMEQYLEQFKYLQKDETFNRVRDFLRKLVSANESSYVDCVYLSYVDFENELFVYVCDSAPVEDACSPGLIDPIFEVNRPIFDDPTRGFPAYITNTEEYGWLVTSGSPIYDVDGKTVIAYAMVDISMTTVRNLQANSIVRLFVYQLITLILIAIVGVVLVYFMMIRPLKRINRVATSYDSNNPQANHDAFQELKVKTRDEIEELASSMVKMENDVNTRIKELTKMNEELQLSREQTKKMKILANKDGLTGVQNKVAYNSESDRIDKDIANKEKVEFAVTMIDLNYLKTINDEYGHDAGDVVLMKLASMICEVFAHSPVYRVGGDEFVVISSGKDYKDITKLVDQFNERIEQSTNDQTVEKYERVSAAIGYSIFDKKKDKCVDDVFRRADKAMYARKHQMKETSK